MPFPKKLLTADEQIILDLRPHWKALVVPFIYSLLIAAATGVLYVKVVKDSTPRLILMGAALVGWIALAGIKIARWKFTEFVLTNERIIARSGVVAKVSKEIPLERVNDVTVTQSVLDRIVRAGDIVLESGGEFGQAEFDDVRKPVDVQKAIYEAAEARKGYGGELRARGGPDAIADELAKLADLRDRGILSAEEFEARKAKLLGG